MTAFATVDLAIDAIKRGAYDFLTKPFKTEVLLEKLDRLRSSSDWQNVQAVASDVVRIGSLIGRSHAARQLFDQIRAVADNERSLLIEGEPGTGALSVAEAIHQLSRRSGKPFVSINCAAFGPQLTEVELFGSSGQLGRLETTRGGTLFLDEIDTLSSESQVKLLQVLEGREAGRANDGGAADVRILCGTHKDLKKLVEAGRFRQDLYYRVAAVTLLVPPLRDRREDIPLLAEEYLRRQASNGNGGRSVPLPTKIGAHAVEILLDYPWPDNIIELEHVVERAAGVAAGDVIESRDIQLPKCGERSLATAWMEMDSSLTDTIAGVERKLIDAALRRATGNQAKAAQFLGIPRTTLRDKMTKYGMVGNLASPLDGPLA